MGCRRCVPTILFFEAIDLLAQCNHDVLCIGQATLDLDEALIESSLNSRLFFAAVGTTTMEVVDRRGDDDDRRKTREKVTRVIRIESDDAEDTPPKAKAWANGRSVE